MGLLDRPQQPQRYGLLAPGVAEAMQAGMRLPPPPPAAPRRERGAPGFLTYLLGGSEGMAAETARRRAEEMRPQIEAQRAQTLAGITDPTERALFLEAPEVWAENAGYRLRPRTLAPGSVERVNGQTVGGAPVVEKLDDRFGIFDPMNPQGGAQYSAPRGPTFAEETDRAKVENPISLSPGAQLRDPQTGALIAQGLVAPEVVSTPQGGSTNVINPMTGAVINTVQGNPEAPAGGRNGAGNYDATTRGSLQSASQAASLARQRAADARRFLALNKDNPTGLGARMLGPLAGLNPAYEEMRAISARLIPGERTPGSGPMSDGDAVLYGRAVLDIDKPGPTNQALAGVVIANAEREAEYASFLDEYAGRNGNLVGANEDWQAYVTANPLFASGANGQTTVRTGIQPWRTFMGYGARQRGGAQGRAGGAAPAAGGVSREAAMAEARRRGLIP